MKDDSDRYTLDMHEPAKPRRSRKAPPAGLPVRPLILDEATAPPTLASDSAASGLPARPNFVPVVFVARDWGVTPRRIRALLAEGRLSGEQLGNGCWQVRFPYLYAEGLRGPVPRRHLRPAKPRRQGQNHAERSAA